MDNQYAEDGRRSSGCAIAILIVTLVGLIGMASVAAVGYFAYLEMERAFEGDTEPAPALEVPATLDVKLQAPGFVKLAEEFDLVLLTRNLEEQDPIELYSVDVAHTFLEGFEVLSVEPEPGSSEQLDDWNQRRWLFQLPVEAGDSLSVTFRLKAVRVGHYVGDIDVCNPEIIYTTVAPNIDIEAGEEQ